MIYCFDLDGTLTDPREGITKSIAHALERMGHEPPPLQQLEFAIGPPLRGTFAQLLCDDRRESVERAIDYYRERYTAVGLFENAPYPGIGDTLAGLRSAGATLFVATSKPHTYATRIVEHFGLRPHFEFVHGSELDGTRDDKRELLAHILEQHGLDPAGTSMVGDRGVDMSAARHHGLTAIGALWGFGSREELLEAGAQRLCAGHAELL